ncbi:MAG: cellulose biosynthesis (CelD)-like protein, partial [Deltaproteobacteria bacterium]|nr:cellulose biosynthesis (CelD)-like protein [Deltaproteobacteria bacterium]
MRTSLIAFDELRHGDDWKRWGTLTSESPPFLTPEFFALARPFVNRGQMLVAGSWSDGQMIGALPLVLDHHTLRAMRGEHSPGYDYCGTREGIAEIWRLLRDDQRWSELVLDKVPRDSLLVRELPALALADHCPAIVRPHLGHPFFSLPGFEARMKPKFRANMQRCARKAGDVVLERILVPTRDDLDEAGAIEGMAWKAAAGTSIESDPRAAHLYQALTRVLGRRGRSSLYFLRIDGKRVATLFALEDRHTLFALKIGYDPHHANLSPGHLLVWKVAADAEQRGLSELDFVGHDAEWKRKWTDQVHDQVVIVIYRHSARGLFRYALHEVAKPLLPDTIRETPRSPLPRRCQRADVLGEHSTISQIGERISRGLGIKSGLRNALHRRAAVRPRLGEPSGFAAGAWVRVRDEAALRATLDEHAKTRGLAFVPAQWRTCGGVFRVARHVRRLRDDRGRFRPVSRTVLLEHVDCGY